MLVEAPGFDSTTKGWPKRSESSLLYIRAKLSDSPPTGKGIIILTGRLGYSVCACTKPLNIINAIKETGSFALFKSDRAEYKDGEQMRDFVYVKDCCDIMWWFVQNPAVNGLFNAGSGKARSWNSLLTAIFNAMGKEPSIQYIDMPEDLRSQYQYFTEAPIQKLRNAGYSTPLRSLEDGITDYVKNYLSKPEQHW